MKYKLICLDMNGVLFPHTNFWMRLHKALGTLEEGVELTKKYLKTDYERLKAEVIGRLWKGKSATKYYKLIETAKYNPGVKEGMKLLKKKGYKFCIITSGPHDQMQKAMNELGIDDGYSNKLEIKDNVITGYYRKGMWPIAYDNKVVYLRKICSKYGITLKEVIAVGDDDNCIRLFKKVGLSVAFNTSCQETRKAANIVVEGNNFLEVVKKLP